MEAQFAGALTRTIDSSSARLRSKVARGAPHFKCLSLATTLKCSCKVVGRSVMWNTAASSMSIPCADSRFCLLCAGGSTRWDDAVLGSRLRGATGTFGMQPAQQKEVMLCEPDSFHSGVNLRAVEQRTPDSLKLGCGELWFRTIISSSQRIVIPPHHTPFKLRSTTVKTANE